MAQPTVKSLACELSVYQALKHVCSKKEAVSIRNKKTVRRYLDLEGKWSNGSVRRIIAEYGIDEVCNVVLSLLQEEIFASKEKAEKRLLSKVGESSLQNSSEKTCGDLPAGCRDGEVETDSSQSA